MGGGCGCTHSARACWLFRGFWIGEESQHHCGHSDPSCWSLLLFWSPMAEEGSSGPEQKQFPGLAASEAGLCLLMPPGFLPGETGASHAHGDTGFLRLPTSFRGRVPLTGAAQMHQCPVMGQGSLRSTGKDAISQALVDLSCWGRWTLAPSRRGTVLLGCLFCEVGS